MIIEIIRFLFILVGALTGAYASNIIRLPGLLSYRLYVIIISIIIGTGVGYVAGGVIGRRLVRTLNWVESNIQKIPFSELISSIAGLLIGLILALLISLPAFFIPDSFRFVKLFYVVFAFIIFGWFGVRVGGRRWEDLDRIFQARKPKAVATVGREIKPKLIDTNIIIDGRITDIVKTGFLEGTLILPRYVLKELQLISDSEDSLKRARGRRGLDILRLLQGMIDIEISETDYNDIREVDAKLVRQAQKMGAVILTNDYNLNKVAAVEGVTVLNINELANAVKPVTLPGE
ncbi:MAG TPA: hypothetical protein ENH19_00605, partial [Actinobacteria bacterium]|nr:hypothetical protein [Actinomycetes bacterium]HEX21136.1 hypothetical protein [Actinomycetota bacterium]